MVLAECPVLQLDPFQFVDHGVGDQVQKKYSGYGVNQVKGQGHGIHQQEGFQNRLGRHPQNGPKINDSPINKEGGECSVQAEDQAAFPGGLPDQALLKEQAGQESDEAKAKHLPGGPGTLTKNEIGNESCHGSHQESGLLAQADPCDDHDSHHRLELGNHEKGSSSSNADGHHHCKDYHFPGLGLSAFKTDKERNHGIEDQEQADEIILSVVQKDHAPGHGENGQKGDAAPEERRFYRESSRIVRFKLSRHDSITSFAVTAPGNRWRDIRLAAVV